MTYGNSSSVAETLRRGKSVRTTEGDLQEDLPADGENAGADDIDLVNGVNAVNDTDTSIIRTEGKANSEDSGLVSNDAGFFGAGGLLSGMMSGADAEVFDEATMENFDASEIRIPRMSIMQPLSPLAVGRDAEFKPGQVVDNVDNLLLSSEVDSPWLEGVVADSQIKRVDAVLFIPIFKLPVEFVKWKDRSTEGRGMHWRTLNKRDTRVRDGCWPPYGQWQASPDADRRSPPVTVNINFAGCVIDPESLTPLSELCIATFAKTSNSAGKDLTTRISRAMRRSIPIFGMSYWLWIHEDYDERSNSTYYSFKIAPGDSIIELFGTGVTAVAGKLLSTFNEFANKKTGRTAQEGFLNASSVDDDYWDDEDNATGGVCVDTSIAIDVASDAAVASDADNKPDF